MFSRVASHNKTLVQAATGSGCRHELKPNEIQDNALLSQKNGHTGIACSCDHNPSFHSNYYSRMLGRWAKLLCRFSCFILFSRSFCPFPEKKNWRLILSATESLNRLLCFEEINMWKHLFIFSCWLRDFWSLEFCPLQ